MAAELRLLRQRVRAVQSIRKTTRAFELIATSRIGRARARVAAAKPYAEEITRVISALGAAATTLDHPLLTPKPNPRRAGVLVVTSDRGRAGGYNANVLPKADEFHQLLPHHAKPAQLYLLAPKRP